MALAHMKETATNSPWEERINARLLTGLHPSDQAPTDNTDLVNLEPSGVVNRSVSNIRVVSLD